MRDIKALHPRLQQKVMQLQDACASQGLKIGIGECLRTVEEQDALYAKGRTVKGNKVTNAKGSTYSSQHQWGIAFDFYRNDGKGAYYDSDGFFTKVGKIGKALGLGWGGDWKSPVDKPHFYLPDWGSTTTKLKSQYKTPEKFLGTNLVSDVSEVIKVNTSNLSHNPKLVGFYLVKTSTALYSDADVNSRKVKYLQKGELVQCFGYYRGIYAFVKIGNLVGYVNGNNVVRTK